jgi:hypothetical protein
MHKNSTSHSTRAERLLAHARICREIADATLNEDTGSKLEWLAKERVEAPRDANSEPQCRLFRNDGTRPITV